jgi:ATP-dependent Lon protease
MKAAPEPRRVDPSQAQFSSNVAEVGIGSTRGLEPSTALGDDRGPLALSLALSMGSAGYHAFASGVQGPDRLERIAALVRARLGEPARLSDWIYVHNFEDPSRPRAIRLTAGDANKLKRELTTFLRELREDLPKAFREQAFDLEKARVVDAFQKHQREDEERLNHMAAKESFAIRISSEGNIVIAPLVNGKPIEGPEEFQKLGPERISELEQARGRLDKEIRQYLERTREERHRLDEEVHTIEREFAQRIAEPRVRSIASRYENAKLASHLDEMLEHILEHLDPFRTAHPPELPMALAAAVGRAEEPLALYDVNIVVDNSRTETLPTVVVDSPTYKNLFGTIERTVDPLGRITTDFSKVHAGALISADGGVVILQAEDALVEPFVWRILRRTLRSGRVEIEAYDPFVLITPAALRPEPIKVETKVVLVGARWMYEMLLALDEEFADLFKILADFSPVVERNETTTRALCGRIARIVDGESLLHFGADGLDAIVELAVRETGDRRRIHLGSERVLDTAREASAHARTSGRDTVTRADVRTALDERRHRLDRIEVELDEAVERGHLLIDVEGRRVGQVNALSVMELGSRAFGRTGRVSATVGLGQRGVVNIEREVKLSGSTHDKGVLILEGFLRDRFARGRPLSLVASLAFEQSYGRVEGDSASLAELLAMLSCIGGFPLRQDLAVTGSVNQVGEVQAVGGVNEKVEGFFRCCRTKGLTDEQGVILPEANVENLVLEDALIDRIKEGTFRIVPVRTVDEALEALTGVAAGAPDEPDTLSWAIDRALDEMAQRLASFGRPPTAPEGQ